MVPEFTASGRRVLDPEAKHDTGTLLYAHQGFYIGGRIGTRWHQDTTVFPLVRHYTSIHACTRVFHGIRWHVRSEHGLA